MKQINRWSIALLVATAIGCSQYQPTSESTGLDEANLDTSEELADELGVEPTDPVKQGSPHPDGIISEEGAILCEDPNAGCPPVNCPCLTSATVNVISVYIKKFRPRGQFEEGSPWVKLEIDPGVYDLMELKDDLFAGVNARNIPPGHYSMIRLTLDGQEITFCDDPTAYPFYVAQENKRKLEIKKGIKIFETFYVCPEKHTKVTLKFPEEGLLSWIKSATLVRLHPKIWVQSVDYVSEE